MHFFHYNYFVHFIFLEVGMFIPYIKTQGIGRYFKQELNTLKVLWSKNKRWLM